MCFILSISVGMTRKLYPWIKNIDLNMVSAEVVTFFFLPTPERKFNIYSN